MRRLPIHESGESSPSDFRDYLYGVGTGHLASGLQLTLFPWLIVGILGEPADRIGLAQMAALIPNLLFILWGGALSDSRHLGSYLFRLYCLYVFPFLGLLLMIFLGQLSYPVVLVFGISFGLITAFVQPARESLLAQVAPHSLRGAVSRASFVQFSASSVGILVAGYMDVIGIEVLLCAQVMLLLLAGYYFRRCHSGGEPPIRTTTSWRNVQSGLNLVWNNKRLLHLMLLVAATGFLGIGAYLVVIPLLARDIYQQDATFFAILQVCFMAGVIVSNGLFIRFNHRLQQSGRALLVSLVIRSCLLLLIALHLPSWLLFLVIFVWGGFSGLSMVLGRTMTHQESPSEYRARTVSIYQLSLFGAAPLGAWIGGELIQSIGVLLAVAVLGGTMLLISVFAIWLTDLWNEREDVNKSALDC